MRFPRAGLSAPLPGGSGPKRPAGTMTGLRATSPAALGRPGVGNAHPYLVPSQEVRELELSGGVRSLPQVPLVERRQASAPESGEGGASRLSVARPARRMRAGRGIPRLPAFRFPLFLTSSLPGLTRQSMRRRGCFRNSAQPLSPQISIDHRVKPGGDEDNDIVVRHTRARRRSRERECLLVSRHPEVAAKRPSKGDGPGASAASFEARYARTSG